MTHEEAIQAIKEKMDYYESDKRLRGAIETLFPELAESEDERMINELQGFLSSFGADYFGTSEWQQFDTWLEKQKEPKHDVTDAKSERVIKAARSVLNNWLDGTDCPDVSGAFVELEYAIREYDGEEKQKESLHIPEMCKENADSFTDEDERIRKALVWHLKADVDFVSNGVTKAECLAYLEKQKENPKSANSIFEDCVPDAKCGNSRHKVGDSLEGRKLADEVVAYLIKSGYQPIIKDTLDQKHFQIKIPRHKEDFFQSTEYKHCREILDEYYYEGDFAGDVYTLYVLKQKEQKPRWESNNPHTTKWTKEMIDEKFEELVEKYHGQKEQKPVEPSDEELQRHQDELYNFKVFATKQAKEHHISFVHDFEWNNFCAELLSYFNEKQKPVEIHIDNPNIEKFDPDVKITTSDSSADRKVYCEEVSDAFESNSNINIPEKPAEWSDEYEKRKRNAQQDV